MPSFSRFQRHSNALGILSLTLLALFVFWPQIFGGRAFFFGDLELQFYPWSEFWRRELSAGRLPLWNPYSFGGASFAGNPQIGLLYPPSFLLAVFPTITALMFGAVAHLWGSAALFFLWLRRGRLQLGAHASFLGALCWMLGGFFVSKSQFPNMLAALAWLPAVLWSAELLARRPAPHRAVVLGATLGLQLLAAHAQISLYSLYLAFFYAIWNWKIAPRRAPFWKLAACFGAALLLAALLDAGQLLPVIENLRGAERQTLSIQNAPRFVLPLWALTNLFAPYLYGNPASGTWTFHGGGNFWETACYVGILPFGLALWSFKRARFWNFAALTSLILALGPMGGLYTLAFYFLPGAARFHDAARFLIVAGVAFPIGAALGLQSLRNGATTRRWAPWILILSALDLGIFARGVYPLRERTQIAPPRLAWQRDALLQKKQARVWFQNPKTARGLLIRYDDYRTRTPARDAQLALGAIPNTQIWHEILEAGGYDPIASRSVAKRLESLQIAPDATRFPPDYAAKLGADSIRFVALWRAQPLASAPDLKEIHRGAPSAQGLRFWIYRNENCLPRARFKSENGDWKAAKITLQNANFLEIEVPRGAQQLELADNFAPSWSATQNGERLGIRATPRGFRVLNLKPSSQESRVRLIYAPTSFRLGVFVSLCALSLVVTTLTAKRKSRKSEHLRIPTSGFRIQKNGRAPSL